MLEVTLRVNQHLVGALVVVRQEELEEGKDEHLYKWTLYEETDNSAPMIERIDEGVIAHTYDDGMWVLTQKIVDRIVADLPWLQEEG